MSAADIHLDACPTEKGARRRQACLGEYRKASILTSRRMVKQHEQAVCLPAICNVVGWKKFWVVFSKACTEKFSQYVMTLIISTVPLVMGTSRSLKLEYARLLGKQVVDIGLARQQLALLLAQQGAELGVGVYEVAGTAPYCCGCCRVRDELFEFLFDQHAHRPGGLDGVWDTAKMQFAAVCEAVGSCS